MTSPETLALIMEQSKGMVSFFAGDLTPQQMLHRPVPGANCAAWLIGHLVLTERNLHKRLGVESPELPAGFEQLFARDEAAPKRAEYGDTSGLIALFEAHRDLSIEAVRSMTIEKLTATLDPPHPRFGTVAALISFLSLHVVMHMGQITMIRRSLGMPPKV